MSQSDLFDIAIIGAGIAGASLAWRLADQRRIIVLERESQPGYHSTGRSAAMFMEAYGTPQIQALTRASREFLHNPPSGFAEHSLVTPRGCLYMAKRGQEEQLQEVCRDTAARGGNVHLISARETLDRVPILREDILAGAMYEPEAKDIEVHALHNEFLRGMRNKGGELRCNAGVIAAKRENGGWLISLADGSRIIARQVINAAGAWADLTAELFGARSVGLQPCRRTVFTFAPPADHPGFTRWPTVIDVDETFYFKPDAGQLLGTPANADPVPPQDVMPEELDVAIGIHRIQEMTTLHIPRPNHTWAGLRSFVSDGDLVVGWDRQCEDFFWLAAQGGYGIQSSVGTSLLAATLILGQPLPEILLQEGVTPELLSPSRLR